MDSACGFQIIRASSSGDLVMAAFHGVWSFSQATKNLKQFIHEMRNFKNMKAIAQDSASIFELIQVSFCSGSPLYFTIPIDRPKCHDCDMSISNAHNKAPILRRFIWLRRILLLAQGRTKRKHGITQSILLNSTSPSRLPTLFFFYLVLPSWTLADLHRITPILRKEMDEVNVLLIVL